MNVGEIRIPNVDPDSYRDRKAFNLNTNFEFNGIL